MYIVYPSIDHILHIGRFSLEVLMHCLFYDYVVAISVFRNWVEKTQEEKNKIIDPYLLISHHLEAVLQSRVRALNFPFFSFEPEKSDFRITLICRWRTSTNWQL